jgi:transposase
VLLKADEGPEGPEWSDDQIAETLELSSGGVAAIRRRYAERGLEGCVRRKAPEREYKTKFDGEQEAELIRLACSEAPEGHSQWSLRLLADRLVELDVVDTISHETVRQTLQTDRSKTGSSRTDIASG